MNFKCRFVMFPIISDILYLNISPILIKSIIIKLLLLFSLFLNVFLCVTIILLSSLSSNMFFCIFYKKNRYSIHMLFLYIRKWLNNHIFAFNKRQISLLLYTLQNLQKFCSLFYLVITMIFCYNKKRKKRRLTRCAGF